MEEVEEEKLEIKKKILKKQGGKSAAACRTHREIKGASPFIDCIKIGLHL